MSESRGIGIFGGMFDPVHHGHLRLALDVQQALDLSEVRLLPCGHPPHRAAPRANAQQRVAMLRAAIADEPLLSIDEREVWRDGPSYMVDTAQSLREELDGTPVCLIIGMDAFLALHTWHEWTRLPELLNLVVVQRPGWQAEGVPAPIGELLAQRQVADAAALLAKPAGNILLLQASRLEISSTHIRQLVAAGKSPRYLLPDAVLEIIQKQFLYRNETVR
ncbi:MAG: nicotinate-nucleotide adenylyltransferase [Pseudomonadota bacterium]